MSQHRRSDAPLGAALAPTNAAQSLVTCSETLHQAIERGNSLAAAIAVSLALLARERGFPGPDASQGPQAGSTLTSAAILTAIENGLAEARDEVSQATWEAIDTKVCALLLEHRTKEAAPTWTTDAARDVLAERARQVSEEGWTPMHDDQHEAGELAAAAGCYALWGWGGHAYSTAGDEPNPWPWDRNRWKPSTLRSHCVKAAALLIAEIERIDRAEPRADAQDGAQ
ncbi:hypothetical protein [Paraburkholderia unamae]|nr:hypothetical protein [Paraburkholderia unamae]